MDLHRESLRSSPLAGDTVLQEAQDAGIPVIIADREIEASDDLYDAWVGTNTTNEGITAGNWLAEYLGDKTRTFL